MGVDVLIVGVNHSAREPPAVVLARVLGMPPEQARRVARAFPSMLVTGATRAQAESVAAQLREGGIKVEVVDRDEPARPAPAPAPAQPERSVARRSGPREVREERVASGPAKHRDAFEERASRTQDGPAKHRDMFEERPSRTMAAPLKHRDVFEERPSRTVDAPPRHRDAFEERMARGEAKPAKPREIKPAKHRDAFEERMAARPELAQPKHRDAFEERMSRGDPQQPRPAPAPSPAPSPVPAPVPVPTSAPALFEERPSRAQPLPFLQDTFDMPPAPVPDFPAFADEPDPFAAGTVPRTTADFGSLDDVFGAAAADTAVRRGLDAKRATAADAEVESLFEAPAAGRPVQARPRQTASSPEPRERAERPAAEKKPVALPPMAMGMSFDEPAPKRRRWLWAVVGLALIFGAFKLTRGGGETHTGSAWAQGDAASRPTAQIHFLVRMAPRGIDRSMAAVLRQLVDGIYKVQISDDGFPQDAQCLLVRGDDGKRQQRLERLLKTGVALELDELRRKEFSEHAESLREALGDAKLTFTPICLSVDAWVEQEAARKAPGG